MAPSAIIMMKIKSHKLKDIVGAASHNRKITVRCIISGKSIAPYCIPKRIKITCLVTGNQVCKYCQSEKGHVVEVLPVDETILRFIGIHSTQKGRVIKEVFKLRHKFIFEEVEMQNVERIFVIPQTGKNSTMRQELVNISYYVGSGLSINMPYEMSGYTTVDPTDQTTTHVFTAAVKLKSDLDSFVITKELHNQLNEFCQPDKSSAQIMSYLEKLYENYALNVTKIYHRFDLHLAIDLAFRSVLSFRFDNEYVHKGWSDVMIIGDTRCGKGYVAEKLVSYFGVGEVISADNASFAGLVGGLQMIGKHWVVTWGKLPLNDGGLVIVDEASELKDQDWTRLSRIRSEGVAEVTKIHTQITNARTRIIFIANPIRKTISNYSYGIQSILEIVTTPEDIARFDYVLVVAHDEVPMTEINVSRDLVKSMHPSLLEQELIMWTWSRKVENVVFSPEAIKFTYEQANLLASRYTFSIPLIQGENIRIKLAKIAVAFAARLYSNKENGKYLFVDRVHVECAVGFLNTIYKKPQCGYQTLSQLDPSLDPVKQQSNIDRIEKYFNSYKNKLELCKCLLTVNNLDISDIVEHLNQPKEVANEIISKLLKYDCITKKNTRYVKTPPFTEWLKRTIFG